MIHSSIENFQLELLMNSEQKADDVQVSPAIAKADDLQVSPAIAKSLLFIVYNVIKK
jgi:hypothetical protein